MSYKRHESTVTYQIIQKDTILTTKNSMEEAIEAAKKYSNVSSDLIFVRSVKIETTDEFAVQLGKIKY